MTRLSLYYTRLSKSTDRCILRVRGPRGMRQVPVGKVHGSLDSSIEPIHDEGTTGGAMDSARGTSEGTSDDGFSDYTREDMARRIVKYVESIFVLV